MDTQKFFLVFGLFVFNFAFYDRPNILDRVNIGLILFTSLYTSVFYHELSTYEYFLIKYFSNHTHEDGDVLFPFLKERAISVKIGRKKSLKFVCPSQSDLSFRKICISNE